MLLITIPIWMACLWYFGHDSFPKDPLALVCLGIAGLSWIAYAVVSAIENLVENTIDTLHDSDETLEEE